MSTGVAGHIRVDERGVAWIDDTNVKVVEVITDKLAHGSSAEEIHFQYPHLSLAQIYAALSYYHDHQAVMDEEIQQRLETAEKLAAENRDSPFRRRLRKLGKLP